MSRGQFGQNQFSQFSELARSIYGRTSPTGQFWQRVSSLSLWFKLYAYLELSFHLLFALGFLYMDVHNTRLITDVQYLAPLMAYFNSKLGPDSKILTLDDGE